MSVMAAWALELPIVVGATNPHCPATYYFIRHKETYQRLLVNYSINAFQYHKCFGTTIVFLNVNICCLSMIVNSTQNLFPWASGDSDGHYCCFFNIHFINAALLLPCYNWWQVCTLNDSTMNCRRC